MRDGQFVLPREGAVAGGKCATKLTAMRLCRRFSILFTKFRKYRSIVNDTSDFRATQTKNRSAIPILPRQWQAFKSSVCISY